MKWHVKAEILLFFILTCSVAYGNSFSNKVTQEDDFDADKLSRLWVTNKLPPNALQFISAPVRRGNGAVKICVQAFSKSAIGGDHQLTERAELREAPHIRLKMGVESWYSFSFYIPSDFPIVNTRLVLARWKQSFTKKKRIVILLLHYAIWEGI